MTRWWQAPNVVPLAAILAFSVIVGVQGREIKALKSRLDALEATQESQKQLFGLVWEDFVSRLDGAPVERQGCGPRWNYDPASATLIVCGTGPVGAP